MHAMRGINHGVVPGHFTHSIAWGLRHSDMQVERLRMSRSEIADGNNRIGGRKTRLQSALYKAIVEKWVYLIAPRIPPNRLRRFVDW